MLRAIKRILLVLSLLIVGLVFLFAPSYVTTLHYQNQTITIYRDSYNIPNIHAPSRKAYLYAWGYVQAQDRLFQMQFKRLVMQGRLSEFVGQKTLPLDKFFRELDLKSWGERNAQRMKQQNYTDYLQYAAYADGINDQVQSLKFLPLDFHLSGIKWHNWTVASIFGMKKLIQWSFSFSVYDQFARSHLLSKYSKEECQRLLPNKEEYWAFDSTTIIEDQYIPQELTTQYLRKNKKQTAFSSEIIQTITNLGIFQYLKSVDGSNSWAISGKHTQSGKPLLANDPHLQSSIPSQWYQIYGSYAVNGRRFNYAGVGPAGIPFLIGKNNYAAIGVTLIYTDNQDLFRQKIRGNQYLVDDKWRPLKIRQEIIKIKGQAEQKITVLQTHRGPIIHYLFGASGNFYIQQGLSIQWTGFNDEFSSLVLLTRLAEIQHLQSLNELVKTQIVHVFNANLLYATNDGHIGYHQLGIFPVRRRQNSGNFIKDGSTTQDDWLEILPIQHHLRVIDPESGYLVTANNKVSSHQYYRGLHQYQIYTARADRIKEIIQSQIAAGRKFSVDKMKEMLFDSVDVYCKQILPYLLSAIPTAQTQFKDFDCNFSSDSYKATMYEILMFEYHHLTKPHKTQNMSIMTFHHNQQRILNQIKSHNKIDQLNQAWNKMQANLTSFFKTSLQNKWKWGKYHQDVMHHLPFGSSPLKFLYDRTFPGSGNINTVNVGKMNKVQFGVFEINHRATYRAVYSLAQNQKSWFIVDSGSSQYVFSDHYDDQWELFSKNKMIQIKAGKSQSQEL